MRLALRSQQPSISTGTRPKGSKYRYSRSLVGVWAPKVYTILYYLDPLGHTRLGGWIRVGAVNGGSCHGAGPRKLKNLAVTAVAMEDIDPKP